MFYHLPSQWPDVEREVKTWCEQWSRENLFWTFEELKRTCQQESAVLLDPCGCIVLLKTADDWELLFIWVDPSKRRKGVGERMLSELFRFTRGQRIFLEVSELNSSARDLYLRKGFEIVRERPNYYKDGSRAMVMELRVSQE